MTVLSDADLYLRGAETPARLLGGVCPRGRAVLRCIAPQALPPPSSRTSPSAPSITTRSSSAISRPPSAPTPWMRWRLRTRQPASRALLPGHHLRPTSPNTIAPLAPAHSLADEFEGVGGERALSAARG